MSDETELSIPDGLLNKLEFANTTFGTATLEGVQIAAGCRESFNPDVPTILEGETVGGVIPLPSEPVEWYGIDYFLPVPLEATQAKAKAKNLLLDMLDNDLKKYHEDGIFALVVSVDFAFLLYAEGLIKEGKLEQGEYGLYETTINLLGRTWILFIQDAHGILSTEYSCATVDSSFSILL